MAKVFRVTDMSTSKVVARVKAESFTINGHVVTFYENLYSREVNGVLTLTPGILVSGELEEPETPDLSQCVLTRSK